MIIRCSFQSKTISTKCSPNATASICCYDFVIVGRFYKSYCKRENLCKNGSKKTFYKYYSKENYTNGEGCTLPFQLLKTRKCAPFSLDVCPALNDISYFYTCSNVKYAFFALNITVIAFYRFNCILCFADASLLPSNIISKNAF